MMRRTSADRGTVGGILIAVVGIAVGLFLDGGNVRQILQPNAALIVFGGTLGAVMVQYPLGILREAVLRLRLVFFEPSRPSQAFADEMLGYAVKARRRGVGALEGDLENIEDPFLRKCLTHAVDGMRADDLLQAMEIDLASEEEKDEVIARVFDSAGGFAPTVGIIGAVLGLIQVMQRLDNIGEVGKGIAVAFVATLYGVGSANLLFLPLAGKMRIRSREQQVLHELMLDATLAIVNGSNSRELKQRLASYLAHGTKPKAIAEAAAS